MSDAPSMPEPDREQIQEAWVELVDGCLGEDGDLIGRIEALRALGYSRLYAVRALRTGANAAELSVLAVESLMQVEPQAPWAPEHPGEMRELAARMRRWAAELERLSLPPHRQED